MDKTCTTCKFEPDWRKANESELIETDESGLYLGRCKQFIKQLGVQLRIYKDTDGSYFYRSFLSNAYITDCNLWEAKDE